MLGSPSNMRGRSEWDRQAANVKRLAEAYGTTFPFAEGATAGRMNDKATAGAASAIATAADRFKSDLDKDTILTKAEKDAAKKDVEALTDHANAVKSRINDGRPATSEVRQLVEQVAKIHAFLGAHPIPTMTNWQAVQESLGKLQEAFGLPK